MILKNIGRRLIVDITALENELKAGKLNNIYLLYGEERFLLDNNVKKNQKIIW